MNNFGFDRRKYPNTDLATIPCLQSVGLTDGIPYVLENFWLNTCPLFKGPATNPVGSPCWLVESLIETDPVAIGYFTIMYDFSTRTVRYVDCAGAEIVSYTEEEAGFPEEVYNGTGFVTLNSQYTAYRDGGEYALIVLLESYPNSWFAYSTDPFAPLVFYPAAGSERAYAPIIEPSGTSFVYATRDTLYKRDSVSSEDVVLSNFLNIQISSDVNNDTYGYFGEYRTDVSGANLIPSDNDMHSCFVIYKVYFDGTTPREIVGYIADNRNYVFTITGYSDDTLIYGTNIDMLQGTLKRVNIPNTFPAEPTPYNFIGDVVQLTDFPEGADLKATTLAHNQISDKYVSHVTEMNYTNLGMTKAEFAQAIADATSVEDIPDFVYNIYKYVSTDLTTWTLSTKASALEYLVTLTA